MGAIGFAATGIGAPIGVFVDDANDKRDAKEQYQWFSDLGDDGVTPAATGT